jgi:hypothetical protein
MLNNDLNMKIHLNVNVMFNERLKKIQHNIYTDKIIYDFLNITMLF